MIFSRKRQRSRQSTSLAAVADKPPGGRAARSSRNPLLQWKTAHSLTSYQAKRARTTASRATATSVFPFTGLASDELTCTSGERLNVLRKLDENWAFVVNAHGKQGIVPMQNLRLDPPRLLKPDPPSL